MEHNLRLDSRSAGEEWRTQHRPGRRRAERQWAVAIHQALVEQFIASHRHAPCELVIDSDATDDPVHGHQPGRFFHGYYDRYCFLPLYAFCGRQLLVAYLRPSNIDAARHTWAILSRLVKRLRQAWPGVPIMLRGGGGTRCSAGTGCSIGVSAIGWGTS